MGSNHRFTPYYLFSSYPLVIEPQSITNLMADLNKDDICQFSVQTGGQCCVLQKGAMLSSPPPFASLVPTALISCLEACSSLNLPAPFSHCTLSNMCDVFKTHAQSRLSPDEPLPCLLWPPGCGPETSWKGMASPLHHSMPLPELSMAPATWTFFL